MHARPTQHTPTGAWASPPQPSWRQPTTGPSPCGTDFAADPAFKAEWERQAFAREVAHRVIVYRDRYALFVRIQALDLTNVPHPTTDSVRPHSLS